MFKSAFCTHWEQKHCPHSEDSAPSNHRCVWIVYIHGTEVGRPDWKQGSINNYHFTVKLVLTEGQLQYDATIGSFQQNFGVTTNFNSMFYNL